MNGRYAFDRPVEDEFDLNLASVVKTRDSNTVTATCAGKE